MRKTSVAIKRNFKNTFLSYSKDQEMIWRKLFVESAPYSDKLKRLLIINEKDCLDENQEQYNQIIRNTNIHEMFDKQYIRIIPRLEMNEHEDVKSYVLIEFDDWLPTMNPYYRDCIITFTVISHLKSWDLEDYKLRPYEIAGYIDGILNGEKFSGIGELEFIGASQIVLNEYLGGIMLRYKATHGNEDSESQNPDIPAAPGLSPLG